MLLLWVGEEADPPGKLSSGFSIFHWCLEYYNKMVSASAFFMSHFVLINSSSISTGKITRLGNNLCLRAASRLQVYNIFCAPQVYLNGLDNIRKTF